MTIYVIGYDIHPKQGETYTNLIEAIKSLGNWWHCLDSTWLISSNLTVTHIRDFLWQHMRQDDQLLVLTYTRDAAWNGFSEECSTWLSTNL
jgi:hypothetical protein